MNYCVITEYWDYQNLRNASVKGRDDIFQAWLDLGCEPIRIPVMRRSSEISLKDRLLMERRLKSAWRTALAKVGAGDTLVLHTPPSEKFLGMPGVVREVKKRGGRIITVIFDLETLVQPNDSLIKNHYNTRIEGDIFRMSDCIVAHSENMKNVLVERGIPAGKILCMEMFDYLTDSREFSAKGCSRDGAVIIAGNLSPAKAAYLYHLPGDVEFHLYGNGFSGRLDRSGQSGQSGAKVSHMGVYMPEELLTVMDGAYGLVWDGDSIDTCTGLWGRAMKTHVQHKAALMLASGRPLIVWQESSLSSFVRNRNCGFTVSNLNELGAKLASVTEDEYAEMQRNAQSVGLELRAGKYYDRVFTQALSIAE